MPQLKPPRGAFLRKTDDSIVGRIIASLVGCWLMNEGAGNRVQDLSGNKNYLDNGTFNWNPAKFGHGLTFVSASSQYIERDIAPVTSVPFTIVCWFKSSDADNSQGLVFIGDKDVGDQYWSLYARGSAAGDPIALIARNDTFAIAETSTGYSVNTWHQAVAVIRSSTDRSVYIDGGSVGSNTDDYSPAGADRIAFGGWRDSTPSTYLDGMIDHVLLYNRALSSSEIALLYHKPFCMFEREISPAIFHVSTGDVTVTPSALDLDVTLETSTTVIDCTVTPSALDLGTTLETPTAVVDCIVTPSALDLGATLETPTILADIIVTPSTLNLGTTLETPTILADITVTPSALDLGVTLETPAISADVTITSPVFTLGVTLETPTIVDEWFGINSSHLDSHCGDYGIRTLAKALEGDDYWQHDEADHWFILDLGTTYNIKKLRGRSNSTRDPTSIDIYVSMDKVTWGTAVATGIDWGNSDDWVVTDVLDEVGRYIKVEITDTEHASDWIVFGKSGTPFKIIDVLATPATVVSPSALDLGTTLETPTILAGGIISPPALALGVTIETPTIVISPTVSPSALALSVTVQTPTIGTDRTVSPSVLTLGFTLETPTVVTSENFVLPSTSELAVSLLEPTIHTRYKEIPPEMQRHLIDPFSGGGWLWLCEFSMPGQETRRIARNTEDVNYDTNVFEKFNFKIGEQLFSGDGSIPRVTLRVFQDANRIMETLINDTEGALGANAKLIRVNEDFLTTPVSALEADYDTLASESDTEWVTFTLGIPNPLTQKFPLRNYSSSLCPWATPTLFKGPECQYAGSDTTCTGTYEDCYKKGNATLWGAELGLDPNVIRI